MKAYLLATTVALSAVAFTGGAQAALYGPTVYTSQADAPFHPGDFGAFFLENVEDSLVNTPGLTVTGSGQCISPTSCFSPGLTDSVEGGLSGHSIWASGSVTATFDAAALGSLPTFAGLVWTDGVNPITFEAFDQNGVSLGVVTGSHADGSFSGTTAEDRFYGASNPGGISRLVISDPSGIEVDHIQYGLNRTSAPVPEPGAWVLMIAGFAMAGGLMRRRLAHTRGRSLVSAA